LSTLTSHLSDIGTEGLMLLVLKCTIGYI